MSGGSRRDSLGGGEGLFKRLLQELRRDVENLNVTRSSKSGKDREEVSTPSWLGS